MRRHPLIPVTLPFLLRTCLFLIALSAALSSLAAPVQAHILGVSNSGLAAPNDLVVEAAQDGVLITWTGQSSSNPVNYTLYRSASPIWQEAVVVDAPLSMAVSLESPDVTYSFYDQSAQAGVSYIYWVVGETNAESIRFGPYYAAQTQLVFLPLLARS